MNGRRCSRCATGILNALLSFAYKWVCAVHTSAIGMHNTFIRARLTSGYHTPGRNKLAQEIKFTYIPVICITPPGWLIAENSWNCAKNARANYTTHECWWWSWCGEAISPIDRNSIRAIIIGLVHKRILSEI